MLNTEQKKAMKVLLSGKNTFITGEAGTGKSYFLKAFIDECGRENKQIMITAPTGVAAVNIGGVTLHRAIPVPVPAFGKSVFSVPLSKFKELQLADVLIIDEVSMCRNDVFDYVIKAVRRVEKECQKKIQIVVCGDFFQLPPVVKKTDEKYLIKFGYDKSGFCFTTKAWADCKFKVIEFKQPMRQVDKSFLENLNKARKGLMVCQKFFNKRVFKGEVPDIINICSTNAKADLINRIKLDAITQEPVSAYLCESNGFKVTEPPAEETLLLKPGARVMFTVNDVVHNKYFNGTMGVVTKCCPKYVSVKIDDGPKIDVSYHTWEINDYSVKNGLLTKKTISTFSQLPLKLAYAITIHKSQGQTFERAVISPEAYADGQFYVAVSRIKDISGLYLTDDVLPSYIKVNKKVADFYKEFTYKVSESQTRKQKEVEQKQKKAIRKAKPKTKKNSTKKAVSKTTRPNKGKLRKKTAVKKTRTTVKPMAKPVKKKRKTTKK